MTIAVLGAGDQSLRILSRFGSPASYVIQLVSRPRVCLLPCAFSPVSLSHVTSGCRILCKEWWLGKRCNASAVAGRAGAGF